MIRCLRRVRRQVVISLSGGSRYTRAMTVVIGREKSTGPARPVSFALKCAAALSLSWAVAVALSPAWAQIKPAPPASEPESAVPTEKPTPKADKKPAPNQPTEGKMTLARMNGIIRRLDPKAKVPQPGSWQLTISERPVLIITDRLANRMRIISPITQVAGLPEGALQRMMQANFDTALDARYAIARGVVWATFIHPLAALHDRQFISAIGQTVNLSLTFGKTFSSGAMSFGGGDSRDIIQKKLIEDLQKKGLPI